MLLPHLALAALAALATAAPPAARARALEGETLAPVTLPTLSGGKEPLTSPTAVNVVLFWRVGHERSADTLKQMSACEKIFKPGAVHMVAVVSGDSPRAEVQAAIDAAGLHVPVLIDLGDELYGKLEVREHPLILVADAKGKVEYTQSYARIRMCDMIHAHVRFLLKEIDAAQLQMAMNPERASFPSDDQGKVARRFVNMGKMEAEAGQCDQAVASFQKALEIAPGNKDALAGIAACGTRTAKK